MLVGTTILSTCQAWMGDCLLDNMLLDYRQLDNRQLVNHVLKHGTAPANVLLKIGYRQIKINGKIEVIHYFSPHVGGN